MTFITVDPVPHKVYLVLTCSAAQSTELGTTTEQQSLYGKKRVKLLWLHWSTYLSSYQQMKLSQNIDKRVPIIAVSLIDVTKYKKLCTRCRLRKARSERNVKNSVPLEVSTLASYWTKSTHSHGSAQVLLVMASIQVESTRNVNRFALKWSLSPS